MECRSYRCAPHARSDPEQCDHATPGPRGWFRSPSPRPTTSLSNLGQKQHETAPLPTRRQPNQRVARLFCHSAIVHAETNLAKDIDDSDPDHSTTLILVQRFPKLDKRTCRKPCDSAASVLPGVEAGSGGVRNTESSTEESIDGANDRVASRGKVKHERGGDGVGDRYELEKCLRRAVRVCHNHRDETSTHPHILRSSSIDCCCQS